MLYAGHYGLWCGGITVFSKWSTDRGAGQPGVAQGIWVRRVAVQALYAVSFDIRSAQVQPCHVYERLREHLADWLSLDRS